MTFLLFLISLAVLEYIVRRPGEVPNTGGQSLAKRQAEDQQADSVPGPYPGVGCARPGSRSARTGAGAWYYGKDPGSTPSSSG